MSDGNDDSEISISDIVAAAKANMLECTERMNESESCDPFKEYLARAREFHSKLHGQFTNWVSALKKIQIGNFGLILFSETCFPICLCLCPYVVDCVS